MDDRDKRDHLRGNFTSKLGDAHFIRHTGDERRHYVVAAHDLHASVAATEDFEPGVDCDSSATSWCTAGDGQFAYEQCHCQQSSRWTLDAAGENSPIDCLDR